MDLLTHQRAKPVLPYAGVYRLIDFPLSHCVHSRIEDVWVVEQFQLHSLNDHLANGRPWDLDRTYGGLKILPPHMGSEREGFAQGNADALYRNLPLIQEFAPDLLLVMSADHIYRLDYRDVIAAHLEHKADVTMVTTERPIEQASRHGVVEVNKGYVTGFEYKPEKPKTNVVTAEIFVYDFSVLAETLEKLAPESGEKGLEDYGHTLLPALVDAGNAYAFPLEGYWRDVGTVEAYWEAHMDFLTEEPPLVLDHAEWPIYTYGFQRLPAHIFEGATVTNSMIAPGCQIHGTVERSVLAPGVVVEAGATVRDSVVFHDTQIGANATVEAAIIDSEVRIGENATVGALTKGGKPEITLVAQKARIRARAKVAAGERFGAQTTSGTK